MTRRCKAYIGEIARLKLSKMYWVAVTELNLCYYSGETLIFTIYIYKYTHDGNVIQIPEQQPSVGPLAFSMTC